MRTTRPGSILLLSLILGLVPGVAFEASSQEAREAQMRTQAWERFRLLDDRPVLQREPPLQVMERPDRWPQNLAWRPFRHFGPFEAGPATDQIQILVDGDDARWYYNDFFLGFDPSDADQRKSLAVYHLYHRRSYGEPGSVDLERAVERTPALAHVPGAHGALDAEGRANQLLLSFDQGSCSERYGGSIRLDFETAGGLTIHNDHAFQEVFEYEFGIDLSTPEGAARFLFDVSHVRMSIYVTPHVAGPAPYLFNPTDGALNNRFAAVPRHVEFEVAGVTPYRNGHRLPEDDPEARAALEKILTHVSEGLASTTMGDFWGRPLPVLFAHALLHDQHQNRIGPDDKVVQLLLGDGQCDLGTEQWEDYVLIRWRLHDAYPYYGRGLIDGNVRFWNVYELDDPETARDESHKERGPRVRIQYHPSLGTTDWHMLTGFPLSQCDDLEHVEMVARFAIQDFGADELEPVESSIRVDCDRIRAQAEEGRYGSQVRRGLTTPDGTPGIDAVGIHDLRKKGKTEVSGAFFWRAQALLTRR